MRPFIRPAAAGLLSVAVVVSAAQAQEPLRTIPRDPYSSSPIPFTPDGTQLATGGQTTANVWNVVSGTRTAQLVGHEQLVTVVTFSPNGRVLASGSSDRTIRLWNHATGVSLAVLRGQPNELSALAFSPDSRRLASGSFDGTLIVWEAAETRQLWSHTEHHRVINDIVFLSDGSLATCGGDGEIIVWSANGDVVRRWRTPGTGGALVVAPDGHTLIHGTLDGMVRVWESSTGALLRTFAIGSTVYALAATADGRRFAVGMNGGVAVWDLPGGRELRRWAAHGTSGVTDVSFSPDGTVLATSSSDGTVKLWPAEAGVVATQSVASAGIKPDVLPATPVALDLPSLGIRIVPPDEAQWTTSVTQLNDGRSADQLTGTHSGWAPLTLSATRANEGVLCQDAIMNMSKRTGARLVAGAPYAPPSVGQVAITATGVSVMCIPSGTRPILVSVQAEAMTPDQQRTIARLVGAMGGTVTAPVAASVVLHLGQMGIDVPFQPGTISWTAGLASSGTMDEIAGLGSSGLRVLISMTRIEAQSSCDNVLQAFNTSSVHGRYVTSPPFLPGSWHSTTVEASGGSAICIALGSGVLFGAVSNAIASDDAMATRQLLQAMALAAIRRWGLGVN